MLSHVGLILKRGGKDYNIWYNDKQQSSSQNKGQLLPGLEKNPVADAFLIMGSNPTSVTEVIVK